MPRKPRQASASGYYHFINRGVNKKKIFHRDADLRFYKELLKEYKERFNIRILHYCLMTNHTHLIVGCDDLSALGKFAHYVQRRYCYYYCKTHRWSEQVFRNRYLSLPIESDAYLLECGRYIERNPLDAGMVQDPKEYKYSSYAHYAHGAADDLVTESPLYADLGRNQEERMLVYRFNVIHNRDYELQDNKSLQRLEKYKNGRIQPVPF